MMLWKVKATTMMGRHLDAHSHLALASRAGWRLPEHLAMSCKKE